MPLKYHATTGPTRQKLAIVKVMSNLWVFPSDTHEIGLVLFVMRCVGFVHTICRRAIFPRIYVANAVICKVIGHKGYPHLPLSVPLVA
eukprot:4955409-Amphidinium_carterae.1